MNYFIPWLFFSRKHSPQKINYEIYNKKLLTIIKFFKEWRSMLEGTGLPLKILNDHRNLEYFICTKQLSRRQARRSKFFRDLISSFSIDPASLEPIRMHWLKNRNFFLKKRWSPTTNRSKSFKTSQHELSGQKKPSNSRRGPIACEKRKKYDFRPAYQPRLWKKPLAQSNIAIIGRRSQLFQELYYNWLH